MHLYENHSHYNTYYLKCYQKVIRDGYCNHAGKRWRIIKPILYVVHACEHCNSSESIIDTFIRF